MGLLGWLGFKSPREIRSPVSAPDPKVKSKSHEFIPNARLHPIFVSENISKFRLDCDEYIYGSMTASVYFKKDLIQTFIEVGNGFTTFTNVGFNFPTQKNIKSNVRNIFDDFEPSVEQNIIPAFVYCEKGFVEDNILTLLWNDQVDKDHYIIVSYECFK